MGMWDECSSEEMSEYLRIKQEESKTGEQRFFSCPKCNGLSISVTQPDFQFSKSGWHLRKCSICNHEWDSPDYCSG